MDRALRTTALAVLLLAAAVPLRAQLPADASWATLHSRNFRVTYEAGLEHLARRSIVAAERAHAALSMLVAEPPRGRIDIVVADNVDFSNGYATPFPSNRVVIYAKPPVDVLELQYMADWIDLVVIHELAHVFHLDVTGGLGRVLRATLGRVPFGWPIFPAVFTPTWSIEGLAVAVESALTDHGRLHGSYHEMVVRTAALAGTLDDIDRLTSVSPAWPGPGRVYIYGSLFMEYLAREYGADVVSRIVQATGDAFIPPPLWFGRVGERVLGVTFREAYEAWQAELTARYTTLAATLEAEGLTQGQPLTTHRAYALHPRFSRDGSALAYAANDQRRAARVRVIEAATGRELWTRRQNDLSAVSWLADGSLLTSDLEFTDRFRIHSDLHHLGPGGSGRLTRGARLQDPDVDRDDRRIVAVENSAGTNRLVVIDRATGATRALTGFDEHVHWAAPRFSPDGSRIAAGRWAGGRFDVVVLDTTGTIVIQVTDEPGISTAPAWSHDGHWLLFWSDRTGIPNIYAAEIGLMGGDAVNSTVMAAPQLPRLRQVTNVLTGALQPDVSPDGRWIAYAAYREDGFRIERIPFDTTQWRTPMQADHALIAAGRGEHDHAADDDALIAQVRAAAAAADTMWTGPRRYSGLRHVRPYFWVPTLDVDDASGNFLGIWSYGSDLVGRHTWDAAASIAPRTGRSQAAVSYSFRGLPAGFVHPVVSLLVDRQWDGIFRDTASGRFIDEREDRALAALSLTTTRWRSSFGLSGAGELVRRSRVIEGFAPDNAAAILLGEPDVLRGVRLSSSFASLLQPPFAISPENGVSLRLTGRQRWDTDPRQIQTSTGIVDRDLGYREATGWGAGYLALPLPGFARHVLAARASGLYRDGPGAGLSGVGGASAGSRAFGDVLFTDIGGTQQLLPIRGVSQNTRTGNRAWTASVEYRLPLAQPRWSLRPLPAFLDRIAISGFADAGHAWCDPVATERLGVLCQASDPDAPPIITAGGEITTFLSFYGMAAPVRFGAGVPLQGTDLRRARAWIVTGLPF